MNGRHILNPMATIEPQKRVLLKYSFPTVCSSVSNPISSFDLHWGRSCCLPYFGPHDVRCPLSTLQEGELLDRTDLDQGTRLLPRLRDGRIMARSIKYE